MDLTDADGATLASVSESALRKALDRLLVDAAYFVILERQKGWYVQCAHGVPSAFAPPRLDLLQVEYQDGGEDQHFGVVVSDPVAVVDTFISYYRDGDDWRHRFDWEPVDLTGPTELAHPRADAAGPLPQDGRVDLAGIRLPPGRRVTPDPAFRADQDGAPPGPALWLTVDAVDNVGERWMQLVDTFPATGLWPVIVDPPGGRPAESWDRGALSPVTLDAIDAADWPAFAVEQWAWLTEASDDPFEQAGAADVLATFGPVAPRPADPTGWPIWGALDWLAAEAVPADARSRLALVPAPRPADVPGLVGWLGMTNYTAQSQLLSAVLRDWEDRFGAVLVGLTDDTMTLAVQQGAVDIDQAMAVAGEHLVLCPDNITQSPWHRLERGESACQAYAASLVGATTWRFWWD